MKNFLNVLPLFLKYSPNSELGSSSSCPSHLMDISPASSLSLPLPTRASFHSPDPRTCSPVPSKALTPATSSAWPAPSQLFLRFAYLDPSALRSTALGQPCWKWPSPGYTPFHQLGYLLYKTVTVYHHCPGFNSQVCGLSLDLNSHIISQVIHGLCFVLCASPSAFFLSTLLPP